MNWPYHFLDPLPEAQQAERRQKIDSSARNAQVSVITPLVFLQVYYIGCAWREARRRKAEFETSSSPRLKGRQSGWISTVETRWKRFEWWCGDELNVGGMNLGTKGQVLGAVAWAGWLLWQCFEGTGDDYLHLTRNFGLIAASQLPFHYLLAFRSPVAHLHTEKTPWFAYSLVTYTSHEILNIYHQFLGRIITVLFYCHASLFLNLYVQKGILASKVQQWYIICGLFGVASFTAIGTTALAPIRRWSYRVFYVTHVVLATALLPVLWFHVSHIRIYLYEAAAVYVFNVLIRSLYTKTFTGELRSLPGTSLVEIKIPVSDKDYLKRWSAGQHAYISLSGNALSKTFKSNPFSAASLPSTDGHLHFVARVLDGNTAKLANTASSKGLASHKLTIEGPYGAQDHITKLLRYDRILLVAGGVGGTFIVPLYRQLLSDLSPNRGSYRRRKVTFVWTVRSMADMSWALPKDEKERSGFVERLKVCVTGPSGAEMPSMSNGTVTASERASTNDAAYVDAADGIEMEEQSHLLAEDEHGQFEKDEGKLLTYAGRPDFGRLVDRTFSYGSTQRIAVVVCGPKGINSSLRDEVGRWVEWGRDVWFWEESFAL